jgi:FKBP-type peptidyl-prolyl cis-trans isomerase SlyD
MTSETDQSADLTIAKDRVVRFHYTIRNSDGEVVETTRESEPLAMLQGHGNVLAGIETALDGLAANATRTVTLLPEEAYGERRDDWTQRVSKKYLPRTPKPVPGMTVQLQTEKGPRSVTILKVGNKVVDVDLNHPFAGQTLTFDLEVVEVREAAPEDTRSCARPGRPSPWLTIMSMY